MNPRRRSATRGMVSTAPSPIDQAPALERAIDRLFPADVLANLRDPDRPAPERLDEASDPETRSSYSC